jgi:biotin carboxyl carrier protein
MNATPRLRGDLKATPVEEEGIRYFDVNDPRSGHSMRMYDFEWLIAQRMDGARRFDEIAEWARERLGITSSAADLSTYARTLEGLGFFDPDTGEEIIDEDATPLPANAPGLDAPSRPPLGAPQGDGPIAVSAAMSSAAAAGDEAPRIVVEPEPEPEVEVAPPTPATVEPPKPVEVKTAQLDAPKIDLPPPPPPPEVVDEPPSLPPTPPSPAAHGAGGGTAPVTPLPLPEERGSTGQKKSSAASIVVLLLLLLGVGGVAYMQFFRPQTAKVTVTLASPREVVRLFDGQAPVQNAEAQALSFGEAGKVVDVVAKGAEVKAGQPVATLDGFAALEKQLVDVKDRLGFYEKKNDAAKVAEKKKLLADLEAKAAKVRLLAPSSGTVSEVMVSVGSEVKPGDPAVKIGAAHRTVEFKVAGADAPKVGDSVTMQPAAGGATIAGKVTAAGEGTVTVELGDDAAVKVGDQLRLVKKKEANVVPIPAAAVVKRDGADVVFVLSDGKAKLRKVTVVDRTATEALIGSGLATGDSVITSGADTLQDDQPASTQ